MTDETRVQVYVYYEADERFGEKPVIVTSLWATVPEPSSWRVGDTFDPPWASVLDVLGVPVVQRVEGEYVEVAIHRDWPPTDEMVAFFSEPGTWTIWDHRGSEGFGRRKEAD